MGPSDEGGAGRRGAREAPVGNASCYAVIPRIEVILRRTAPTMLWNGADRKPSVRSLLASLASILF